MSLNNLNHLLLYFEIKVVIVEFIKPPELVKHREFLVFTLIYQVLQLDFYFKQQLTVMLVILIINPFVFHLPIVLL